MSNLERRLQEIGPEAFDREVREGKIPSLNKVPAQPEQKKARVEPVKPKEKETEHK